MPADTTTGAPPPGTAVAFPGQGGDWRAALGVLAAHADHPLVRALAERLGTDRWEELDGLDTRNAQPVVYVSGLAGAVPPPGPSIVAAIGHSLGEITAAAWCGSIDPTAGLDLVVARAELGHAADARRPGAMAAVMRTTASEVEWLRRRVLAEHHGVLEVAVVNSPGQHVLSGDEALVGAAVDLANDEGAVARRLPIGGAYHSPLLVPELDRFRTLVAAAVTATPPLPLVSSTSARAVVDADDLVDTVVRSLVLPVHWDATVRAALDLGATQALDAGPGDTLVRLARFLPDLPFAAA